MKRKSGGLPYHIAGREELLQRMYILLSAKKGGFIYNRELGSRIGGIIPSDAQAAAKAEAYARKALESVPYAEVTGANIDNNTPVLYGGSTRSYDIETQEEKSEGHAFLLEGYDDEG